MLVNSGPSKDDQKVTLQTSVEVVAHSLHPPKFKQYSGLCRMHFEVSTTSLRSAAGAISHF